MVINYAQLTSAITPVRLDGRIILITGAGSGIGEQVALGAARLGATLLLLGRNESNLNRVADQIRADQGSDPVIVPMDLASLDEPQANELSHLIGQQFGRLDGLLHNASLLGKLGPIATTSLADWARIMTVNAFAPVVLTKALLPLLEESSNATVLFTSSGVGRKGRAFWGAYAASKFATEGIAQTLADEMELTSNVTVCCVNPGATRTTMRQAAFPGEAPSTVTPPEDLVPAYLHLLSGQSSDSHGLSINLQG